MAEMNLTEALEREAKNLRQDYIDREILLDMLKRVNVDGFRDKLYDMDTCQRESVYEMVKRHSPEFYDLLGEL